LKAGAEEQGCGTSGLDGRIKVAQKLFRFDVRGNFAVQDLGAATFGCEAFTMAAQQLGIRQKGNTVRKNLFKEPNGSDRDLIQTFSYVRLVWRARTEKGINLGEGIEHDCEEQVLFGPEMLVERTISAPGLTRDVPGGNLRDAPTANESICRAKDFTPGLFRVPILHEVPHSSHGGECVSNNQALTGSLEIRTSYK
jgi:hypothetical protein